MLSRIFKSSEIHLFLDTNVTSETPPRYSIEHIPGIMVPVDFAHILQVYFIGTGTIFLLPNANEATLRNVNKEYLYSNQCETASIVCDM